MNWLIKSGIHLIFPPLCLHCDERINHGERLFCTACATFFELIDPGSRCIYCFAENEGRAPCTECVRKKRWGTKLAASLDYLGAVTSLVKGIKYGRMPYLAKTAGAFMAAQFFHLQWPTPDLIIPVPRRQWFQGENHAHLLAKNLAVRLGTRALPLIRREAGDFSQARLAMQQREKLPLSASPSKKRIKFITKSS